MTLRVPAANILREINERDREWAARGDTFAGSADERMYAAELLGRVIGHAAAADAPEEGRWQAYAATAESLLPALRMFTPPLRLAMGAAAYPLALEATAPACPLAGL